MKIRQGFVSNSSSSSFIAIMKNGQDLTKAAILEALEVKKGAPLYSFAKDVADWMISNLDEQNVSDIFENYIGSYNGQILVEDDMINEILKEELEPDILTEDTLEKIKDKKYRYYEGSASDEEGGLEGYLCDVGINVDTDIMLIKSGGSY